MKHLKKRICMIISILVAVSCVFTIPAFASDKRSSESEKIESELVTLTTSTEVFLDRLVSKSAFSVNDYLSTTDSNDDFASMSRFAIADWAFAKSLITEAQMIEAYCDLLNTKNFENAICLDCTYKKVESYANTRLISATLATKINSVLEQRDSLKYFSNQLQNTRSGGVMLTSNRIMIDGTSVEIQSSDLELIKNIAQNAKNTYEGLGFDFPTDSSMTVDYIIALEEVEDTSACFTDDIEGTQSGNTYLSATTLYIDIDSTGNIETSDAVLRHRLTHGMFHAIQNGYNCIDDWFKEACANWGAWAITGLTTELNLNSFISSTRCMTDDVGGGAMLFPATIDFFYGSVPTIVEIYEQLSTEDDTETAINNALAARGYSDTFEDVFLTMAVELADPGSGYSDISGLQNYNADYTDTYSFGTDFVEDNVEGYGRSYFSFAPASGVTNYTVEFEIVLSGSGSGIVYQYWYNSENEFCIQECNVNANGTLILTHPDSEEGNPSGEVGIIVVSTGYDFSFYIDYTVTPN